MKIYELTYLISPELNEEEIRTLQEKIALTIQEEGGSIREVKNMSRVRLGYPIKDSFGLKKMSAFSSTIIFNLDENKAETLKDRVAKEDQILRHILTVKTFVAPAHVRERHIIREEKAVSYKNKEPDGTNKEEKPKEEKAELNEIEKKLDEILGE